MASAVPTRVANVSGYQSVESAQGRDHLAGDETARGHAEGLAEFPDSQIDAVVESAEECPGECIFIEP